MRRLVLLLVLVAASFAARGADCIVMGVLAFRPPAVMASHYDDLGRYLAEHIGRCVEMRYLGQDELDAALQHNGLDLVFTNPSHYVVLRSWNSLSGALATAIRAENGRMTHSLGGVIITRAERADLAELAHLRGRTIAIPGTRFLGGYQAQALELVQAGVPMPAGVRLLVTGNHDGVVEAVLAGKADAGFIRTGILESLAAEGRVDLARLKVLHPQHLAGFPYIVSTRLYPEWPVVALPHLDEAVARRILVALLSLPADYPAARAAGLAGFAPPADYEPVAELARTLRLPPYDQPVRADWADVWRAYWRWFVAAAVLVLAAVGVAWRFRRLNRKLAAANEALAESENRYRTVVNTSPGIIYELAPDGRFTFVSDGWSLLLGHPPGEVLGRDFRPFVLPEDRPVCEEALRRCLASREIQANIEYRVLHRDGSVRWHSSTIAPTFDAQGRLTGVVGNATDVTARREAEARLGIAASVFSHAAEGILITDPKGVIVDVNEAFTRISGYSREEVLGRNPNFLKSGRQGPDFYAGMWRSLLETGRWTGEVWNRRKNGEVYAELLSISAVRDRQGMVTHYVGIFSDITLLKEQQRQLEHIAFYDPLTGLPNRALLADRMRQAMAQALRRGRSMAVVYLDLDGFKAVNDTHGHAVGDRLLIALAQRMRAALREEDTLARLGGDEFVALLPDGEACSAAVRRLLAAAAEPIQVQGLDLQVSASVGVTLYPQADAVDADQLLRQADQAMYQAKLAGKNRFHVFDPHADQAVRRRYEGEERLREALAGGELELHYQPRVNMRTGQVVGMEALLRWRHPQRGLLAPGHFLPAVRDSALSAEIDDWVIGTALAQVAAWWRAGLRLTVGVNVGAQHLQHPDFITRLKARLAAWPELPPGTLELEVLESSALEDLEQASKVMVECAGLGVAFALDDFGTGYSSLSYLKRLPAHCLKVDQSFVREMFHEPESLAIVEGVLGLAEAFSREVVAEGVETPEVGEILLLLGCEQAQGYAIARPMPAADIPAWVANWQCPSAWLGRSLLSRSRKPILHACVEHKAWVRGIEQWLHGERIGLPPMEDHACRFGLWLARQGNAVLERRAQPVGDLHRRIHELAAELVGMRRRGHAGEALARLPELLALREELVALLRAALTD